MMEDTDTPIQVKCTTYTKIEGSFDPEELVNWLRALPQGTRVVVSQADKSTTFSATWFEER